MADREHPDQNRGFGFLAFYNHAAAEKARFKLDQSYRWARCCLFYMFHGSYRCLHCYVSFSSNPYHMLLWAGALFWECQGRQDSQDGYGFLAGEPSCDGLCEGLDWFNEMCMACVQPCLDALSDCHQLTT